MKRIVFLLIFSLLITFVPTQKAYPFWIWTPKTGKWVNPKYAPKPTPKEQLEYALSFYQGNQLKETERELKSLLKYYPKSAEAAEAQYYLGIVYESQERYYEAYKAYQKVIDKYPFSERIKEINERELKIADKFMSGEKRRFVGMPLPVDNPALEIYAKIVENSQYGPLAPIAQYKLGLVSMGLGRYLEAEDSFQKVISNYPTSEWATAAQYQLASCQAKQSQGPDYDSVVMEEAKDKFEEFVKEHPEANLSKEAEKNISTLKTKEAEANYNIALFYEKQKAYTAAKTYYQIVVDDYSESEWAKPSQEKIKYIEERFEGKKKIDKKVLREIQKENKLNRIEGKRARKQAIIEEKRRIKAEKIAKKQYIVEQRKNERQERIQKIKEEKAMLKQEKSLSVLTKKAQKQAKIEAARMAKAERRQKGLEVKMNTGKTEEMLFSDAEDLMMEAEVFTGQQEEVMLEMDSTAVHVDTADEEYFDDTALN